MRIEVRQCEACGKMEPVNGKYFMLTGKIQLFSGNTFQSEEVLPNVTAEVCSLECARQIYDKMLQKMLPTNV